MTDVMGGSSDQQEGGIPHQGGEGEAARLSQALASQLDLQIDRLNKIRQSKVESLSKIKAGPNEE